MQPADWIAALFTLENSTLSQRSWTKLGQEFAQDGQHTRYGPNVHCGKNAVPHALPVKARLSGLYALQAYGIKRLSGSSALRWSRTG